MSYTHTYRETVLAYRALDPSGWPGLWEMTVAGWLPRATEAGRIAHPLLGIVAFPIDALEIHLAVARVDLVDGVPLAWLHPLLGGVSPVTFSGRCIATNSR